MNLTKTLLIASLAALPLAAIGCGSADLWRVNTNAANAELTIYDDGEKVGVYGLGADLPDLDEDWTLVITAPGYEPWHGTRKDLKPVADRSYTADMKRK
jgi:hypothetical protein